MESGEFIKVSKEDIQGDNCIMHGGVDAEGNGKTFALDTEGRIIHKHEAATEMLETLKRIEDVLISIKKEM